MKTLKLMFLLLMVVGMTACSTDFVRGAYVSPEPCGYVVRVTASFSGDVTLSKCLSLEDATNLAAKVNADMAGKWSSRGDK